MADDPDPPPKRYDLQTGSREFERANPPAAAAPVVGSPQVAADPAERIDVRELYRQAAVPGRVLAREPRPREANDVTAILQHNVAHETAAGLNEVDDRRRPKSRRLRDYIVLMLGINGGLAAVTRYGVNTADITMAVCGLSGMALASAAITWVMWFIVDRY